MLAPITPNGREPHRRRGHGTGSAAVWPRQHSAPDEEPAVAIHWYYTREGGPKQGPVTGRTLRQLAATGELSPTDRVWKDGLEKAVRARRLKGLFVPPAGRGGAE